MIVVLVAYAVFLPDPVQQAPSPRIWSGEEVRFLERPRPEFPMRAQTNRGSVRLICTIAARGTFRSCEIESETPEGSGFGGAAIASMQRGARIEMGADGPSEGDRVRTNIRFWNGR